MTLPLRADAERNRVRLLDAARELFAERGLDVTLDDIARHAGVGTGTAYRRFPNKDALIEELMVARIGELEAAARDALREPDPWDAFRGYFERALALQACDRGLKEILFSSGRGAERVMEARRRLAPVVAEIVGRAKAAGVLRDDIEVSDVPLGNMMLSIVVDFGRDLQPELYQRYLAILLDGMRARPGAEALPQPALDIRDFQQRMETWRRR